MISITTAQSETDIQEILALQQANLKQNIPIEMQASEGFVTVHHRYDVLQRMNAKMPSIIAKDANAKGIEGLNQFSITAAAHDLSVQIRYYQSIVSGRVSVYSFSYGTMWLDRFRQIYPNLVHHYDLWTSSVASKFLGYCQFQSECNQYFPADEPPQIMLSKIRKELAGNNQRCVNNYFSQYHLTDEKL
ncbi:unnamed protein product [Rotaria sp. Silwood1]|nr:unnamed protein product [Rotaria sp. Silwood1]CAF4722370.1 unnamed protein product [Rotaria sp. Silwood1]CAF4723107.1 unnamed protein product [Rotaria sp. Silwood1]